MLMAAGANPTAAVEPALDAGHEEIALMACKAGGKIENRWNFVHRCMEHGMLDLFAYGQTAFFIRIKGKQIEYADVSRHISSDIDFGKLSEKSLVWLLENGMAPGYFIRHELFKRTAFWEHAFASGRLTPDMVFLDGIEKRAESFIRFALEHNADINALGPDIVLKNIQKNEKNIVSLLLDKGIDLGDQPDACLVACLEQGEGYLPLAEQFLEKHGASVNAGQGKALLASIKSTDESMFHKLLELGANVQLQPDAYLEEAGKDESGKKLLLLNLHGLSLKTRAPEILKNNLSKPNSLIFWMALREAPMEALKLCLEKNEFPFEVKSHFESQAKDGTLDAKSALKVIRTHGFNPKNPDQQKLAGLIAACGEDVSDLPGVDLSGIDKKALVAKGVKSPGYGLKNHFTRFAYLVSSIRPAIRIPENAATVPTNDWPAGIERSRNACADMERACKKGGMKAFLRIMAAASDKMADMAQRYSLSSPQTCAELHARAKSWRELAGASPALDGATETAAAFAEPESLYKAALAISGRTARERAMNVLIEHTTLFSLMAEEMRDAQQKDAESLKQSLAISQHDATRKLAVLQERMDLVPTTRITPQSLDTLKQLAATQGADKALETLNRQSQSFDIHFMGKVSGRFHPWIWLRTKFHADAWHASLQDYKRHLAAWQEKDPDGSFATLKETLELTEKMQRLGAPLIAQHAEAENGAAFFEVVIKNAKAVEPFIFNLAKAQKKQDQIIQEPWNDAPENESAPLRPRPPTLERQ